LALACVLVFVLALSGVSGAIGLRFGSLCRENRA
jgi:hypothetical protein